MCEEEDVVSERPTLYDYAGGSAAFVALAGALHERCLADPVLNHPFSHATDPEHLEHLAEYLGEVFGGPRIYSESYGGHSAMLDIHASTGADDEFASRFVVCFDQAIDDAGLPDDKEFRGALHDYMVWATHEVNGYSPAGSVVPENLAFPYWSWSGRET
jgi:hemoglobin